MISIIIPVYNSALNLHIAVDSLRAQTYRDLQIIFVNDGSSDNSLDIIEVLSGELEVDGIQVKKLSHEQNKGVAAARNTGLLHSTGDYIYYLDSDDFLEYNAMELLITNAYETSADIVGCNWCLAFNNSKRIMNQQFFNTPWDAIEKILSGSMRWNLWLFMAKRSLYTTNNIRFEAGKNMGEDLMVTVKLFSYAEKVIFVDRPLYNYNQTNESSLTKNYSDRNIEEVTWNVMETEKFLNGSQYKDRLGNLIKFIKLNIKLPLLISDNKSNYTKWLNWFPEANEYIFENKKLSLRIRLLQFFAIKSQFWLIKLHYYLVVRVVYGIIYK